MNDRYDGSLRCYAEMLNMKDATIRRLEATVDAAREVAGMWTGARKGEGETAVISTRTPHAFIAALQHLSDRAPPPDSVVENSESPATEGA